MGNLVVQQQEEDEMDRLFDEYMDPAHALLGDEGFKELQKQRLQKLGNEILFVVRQIAPALNVYVSESSKEFLARPEGTLTEWTFKIKTRAGGNLWDRIFPRTLISVQSDNGMMSRSIVQILREDILNQETHHAVRSVIQFLAEKAHFSVYAPNPN